MVKNLPANAGDTGDWGSIPGGGKIPWCRQQQPTPVFLLGNPMDRGPWQDTVHGVAESWARLSTLQSLVEAWTRALHQVSG